MKIKDQTDMNGILNVLKPPGMTSFDVVNHLRGILKTRKIGHTGTLDPGAAGVLPVCVGKATGAIEYLVEKDKTYRAELTLGITTDTQDSSGNVLEVKNADVSEESIREVVLSFRGKITQVPPMYSAIKVGGVKLYELARKGITVERPPRQVEIYSIEVLDIDGPKVLLDVKCSKGTYIRTLCADIGDRLGCGAHMSFLVRTRSGPFDINDACMLEDIKISAEQGRLGEMLRSVDCVFDGMPALQLGEKDARRIVNGAMIETGGRDIKPGTKFRLYLGSGEFLALGEAVRRDGRMKIKPLKVFI